jgi:hypothetical protein
MGAKWVVNPDSWGWSSKGAKESKSSKIRMSKLPDGETGAP